MVYTYQNLHESFLELFFRISNFSTAGHFMKLCVALTASQATGLICRNTGDALGYNVLSVLLNLLT